MKPFLTTLIFSILSFNSFSQQVKLTTFFEREVDTLVSDSKKELTQTFKIIVPQQNFTGTVSFSIVKNDFQPDDAEIFLPNDRTLKFDPSKAVSKEFSIKFPRNMKNDRMIILELNATKADGTALTLEDGITKYSIYIKPFVDDSLSDEKTNGYEFWFYTGSNLDLLDGQIFKDVNFKGTYLVNVSKKPSTNFLYITFGKNRYFSTTDSLVRLPFSTSFPNIRGDSISLTKGFYNSQRTIVTENIFSSIDLLLKVRESHNGNSKLFFDFSFYFALQKIDISYKNSGVESITDKIRRNPDSLYRYQPQYSNDIIRQFNYNVGIGLTHILNTKKVNIKTQILTGLNSFNYPYRRVKTAAMEFEYYASDKDLFWQFRIDATVLSPGISLGFETLLRTGSIPLFNVSLTKVLDLKNLSSIFSKVSSISN